MNKRIRKLGRKVHKTSALGIIIGVASYVLPELDGVLPKGWYIGLFVVIGVLHALSAKNGDE